MTGSFYDKTETGNYIRWNDLHFTQTGAGFVDRIADNQKDSIIISGWALFNGNETNSNASMFAVTYCDDFICSFVSKTDREDVVDAFDRPTPLDCGFTINLPRDLFPGRDVDKIAIYALKETKIWGLHPRQNGHPSTYPFWAKMREPSDFAGKSHLSCHWIEHGFILDGLNNVLLCCEGNSRNEINTPDQLVQTLSSNFPEKFSIENFSAKRLAMRPIENRPQCDHCIGCKSLINKVWDKETTHGVGLLNLSQSWVCNLRCTYCFITKNDLHLTSWENYYSTYKILKHFEDTKVLNPRAVVCLSGGEPLLAPDFDQVCKDFFLNKEYIPVFTSNSTIYNKTLHTVLQKKPSLLVTSLDSGTRETYYKVRGKDLFNIVIKNLKKYIEGTPQERLIIKYIVTDENTTERDAEGFASILEDIGIKTAYIDLESTPNFNENIKFQQTLIESLDKHGISHTWYGVGYNPTNKPFLTRFFEQCFAEGT